MWALCAAALALFLPAALTAPALRAVPPVHDADLHEHEAEDAEEEERLRVLVPMPGPEPPERALPCRNPRGEQREETQDPPRSTPPQGRDARTLVLSSYRYLLSIQQHHHHTT